MFRRLKSLLAIACVAMPVSAHATGGVWCDATDEKVDFHFKASIARDGTGGWWGIEGKLVTKLGKLPTHLSRFDIKETNLTQRWLGRDNILLEIQAYDSEPFATVMLTVESKLVEDSFAGMYTLRISDATAESGYVTVTDSVACGAD